MASHNDAKTVEPGLQALLSLLSKWQSFPAARQVNGQSIDSLDEKKSQLPYLAIPAEKAYALFRWGTMAGGDAAPVNAQPAIPTTWDELVSYRKDKDNKGHRWTAEMRKIVVSEEKKRNDSGQTGIRKAMAEELDMTVSALGKHIATNAGGGTKSERRRNSV